MYSVRIFLMTLISKRTEKEKKSYVHWIIIPTVDIYTYSKEKFSNSCVPLVTRSRVYCACLWNSSSLYLWRSSLYVCGVDEKLGDTYFFFISLDVVCSRIYVVPFLYSSGARYQDNYIKLRIWTLNFIHICRIEDLGFRDVNFHTRRMIFTSIRPFKQYFRNFFYLSWLIWKKNEISAVFSTIIEIRMEMPKRLYV